MEEHNKNINRRDFLKIVGISAATTTAAATLYSCKQKDGVIPGGSASTPVPTDKMTYRTSVAQKDRVSLLGYGCMRWPTVPSPDGKGDMIDQDAVNELVDYAIAHGVNYFDTSPVYVQGWSEKSTGIALKRHPREKLFIATKLSNFSNYSRENSIAMYRKSFEDLQTDYIDYYLLHSIGNGGIEAFKARYIDNGMMEFLLKEREAGRIRNLGFSFHGTVDTYDYALSLHDEVKWDFVQIQLNYVDWTLQQGKEKCALLGERNIPVWVMEPVRGGALASLCPEAEAVLKAKAPGRSIASWAIRFAASLPGVLVVLSGMSSEEQLADNLAAMSPFQPLTKSEQNALTRAVRIDKRAQRIPCTGCRYCMPCPFGVDIPGLFKAYNRCAAAKSTGRFLKESGDIPAAARPAACRACGKCARVCPQHIGIPEEMAKLRALEEKLREK